MSDRYYSDLREIRCIIDRGSFVAAARELRVSRASLSDPIRRLEDDAGVQLLNRTTRSVSMDRRRKSDTGQFSPSY